MNQIQNLTLAEITMIELNREKELLAQKEKEIRLALQAEKEAKELLVKVNAWGEKNMKQRCAASARFKDLSILSPGKYTIVEDIVYYPTYGLSIEKIEGTQSKIFRGTIGIQISADGQMHLPANIACNGRYDSWYTNPKLVDKKINDYFESQENKIKQAKLLEEAKLTGVELASKLHPDAVITQEKEYQYSNNRRTQGYYEEKVAVTWPNGLSLTYTIDRRGEEVLLRHPKLYLGKLIEVASLDNVISALKNISTIK